MVSPVLNSGEARACVADAVLDARTRLPPLQTLIPEGGRPESQIEQASVPPARAMTGVALEHWKTFSKFRHPSA